MQVDDPPYLSVGTAVSAKYKGAFCEAKVSKVVRLVKCKVTYKMGLGTDTVSDDQIKGVLRVGQVVQVKHSGRKDFVEATITKIQDCSQYTVVFDDGDITTLRRTALCLKSGRHFNESETLDQLPLTHPEHFSNPVVGGRRGRRNRHLREESSEGEPEEENEPDLEGYSPDIGRVVSVETTDKKRGKDNWFPGLVVIPSAQPTVKINVKDEYLIRSFKDGRYYTVPKKEVNDFSRDLGEKVESSVLSEAVDKALKYLDNNELPVHWERNSLFNSQPINSDSDENYSDSSDDEPCEEKDRFVAQLYKFMDDAGTPLNKSPTIGSKDVDLYKLFSVVYKFGGYNKVTNHNKWRAVATRLRYANNQNTTNQVKQVYKKCLLSYESFHRTLGVTMLNHTRSTKKNKGRSLIRDKDRATPVNSPRPEKEEEIVPKKETIPKIVVEDKPKKKAESPKEEKKKRDEISDVSSSEVSDNVEVKETPRLKRQLEVKAVEKKVTKLSIEKIKTTLGEKIDDIVKDEEKQTRSKSLQQKTTPTTLEKKMDTKPKETKPPLAKAATIPIAKKSDDEKKRGRKRALTETSEESVSVQAPTALGINVGDKLKVYYGPTNESKVTYEAKVVEIDRESSKPVYLVHYTGWNTRYDEWISPTRIAENVSANAKSMRLRRSAVVPVPKQALPSSATATKTAAKRGRVASTTSKDLPRSTTPSSTTSTSSRTKSPATTAVRSSGRVPRKDYKRTRRTSAQTDTSIPSDSDSGSDSETELTRTRSGSKVEEIEIKTYKKRPPRVLTTKNLKKSKEEDEESEKDEELDERPKPATRQVKKSPQKTDRELDDSDDEDDTTNPPKGRDFDLNQIRSELKGFAKAALAPVDADEKNASDDSIEKPEIKVEIIEEDVKKEIKTAEIDSSDDIYEFKEPEPFEFETCPKLMDEKGNKKRLARIYEDIEKVHKLTPKEEPDKPKKSPIKKDDSEDESLRPKKEDPFDKLVESPSFNLVKNASKISLSPRPPNSDKNLLEEPLNLFRELPEGTGDDFSRDMELSDTESQTQPIFSRRDELFSDTFGKSSSEQNTLDLEFSKSEERNVDDDIQASIQRALEPSSTDDDSQDSLRVTPISSSYPVKKIESNESATTNLFGIASRNILTESQPEIEKPEEKSAFSMIKQLASVSSTVVKESPKIEVKTEDGSKSPKAQKIVDKILQKFNSLTKTEETPIVVCKDEIENDEYNFKEEEVKTEVIENPESSQDSILSEFETNAFVTEAQLATKEKEATTSSPRSETSDHRRKKKVISKAYIDSDSDSSDSDNLVIARLDDDSQNTQADKTNLTKVNPVPEESQVEVIEERNFNFDDVKSDKEEEEEEEEEVIEKEVVEMEEEPKETTMEEDYDEGPDSVHSLLLCEETIPRSPAPVGEPIASNEPPPPKRSKSALEMPFASAPGSSNNKNMLRGDDAPVKMLQHQAPMLAGLENAGNRDASAVLENTPPTTPESSSISNLSPRDNNGGLSPNTRDNDFDNFKTNDCDDFLSKRANSSSKMSLYSEEDTQQPSESLKKARDEIIRKRRRSYKGEESSLKRGRKMMNRSRHNSDSDDTSDQSAVSSSPRDTYDRNLRSPRPSKYNFFVEFDPSLDSSQRIAVLQQKLSELRKTYADVKAELAAVERRRKKLRRREREASKATKQELTLCVN